MTVEKIAKLIKHSNHLVIFTGAGVSTASGLPDYRGPDGVWTRRDLGLPAIKLSKEWSKFEPNPAHLAIVRLQELDLLKALISQNVDGLHLKSGINPDIIAELHGNSTLMKCLSCDKRFMKKMIGWEDKKYGPGYLTDVIHADQPVCTVCNGRIISSIVNFGDPMPIKESDFALHHSKLSDVFVVIGSSLVVSPAADYPKIAYNSGATLIIINKGQTPLDYLATVKSEEDCSVLLPLIIEEITS